MMEQQVKEEPGEKKAKLEPDVVVKVKQEKEEEVEVVQKWGIKEEVQD